MEQELLKENESEKKIVEHLLKKLENEGEKTYVERMMTFTRELKGTKIEVKPEEISDELFNIGSTFPNPSDVKCKIRELQTFAQVDRTSRQLVITRFNRHVNHCSNTFQFLIREDKSYLFVYMRSCDAKNKLVNDLRNFKWALNYFSELLKAKPTLITVFFGSLHCYLDMSLNKIYRESVEEYYKLRKYRSPDFKST